MSITAQMRLKRSMNIASTGCEEVECPRCKGKGVVVVKHTRVAGSSMNKHREEKHDPGCSCPRSTVAKKQKCIACGGYGTKPMRPEKVGLVGKDTPQMARFRQACREMLEKGIKPTPSELDKFTHENFTTRNGTNICLSHGRLTEVRRQEFLRAGWKETDVSKRGHMTTIRWMPPTD